MSDKTEKAESKEVIQSREPESFSARVEGYDEQGRARLLRVFYPEDSYTPTDKHKHVSVQIEER